MCLLQPPGYPKRDERDLLTYWVDVQADQSSMIACAFNNLRAIQRGTKEISCHTGWMYRLIRVFTYCMCFLQPPSYPKLEIQRGMKEISCHTGWVYRLIRVFTDCMCLLQPPGYPTRDERDLLSYWVGIQADQSVH